MASGDSITIKVRSSFITGLLKHRFTSMFFKVSNESRLRRGRRHARSERLARFSWIAPDDDMSKLVSFAQDLTKVDELDVQTVSIMRAKQSDNMYHRLDFDKGDRAFKFKYNGGTGVLDIYIVKEDTEYPEPEEVDGDLVYGDPVYTSRNELWKSITLDDVSYADYENYYLAFEILYEGEVPYKAQWTGGSFLDNPMVGK